MSDGGGGGGAGGAAAAGTGGIDPSDAQNAMSDWKAFLQQLSVAGGGGGVAPGAPELPLPAVGSGRERRFRVCAQAPGFRPGPRDSARQSKRRLRDHRGPSPAVLRRRHPPCAPLKPLVPLDSLSQLPTSGRYR